MNIFRLILFIVILLMMAYVIILNWGCAVVRLYNKRKKIDRHHSTVPLVSLIMATIAMLSYPYAPKWWIFLIPILDIGNWLLLVSPFFLLHLWWCKRKSPPSAFKQYTKVACWTHPDGTQRVFLLRKYDGTFSHEHQHFSNYEYKNCWIAGNPAHSIYESEEIALREITGNYPWTKTVEKQTNIS